MSHSCAVGSWDKISRLESASCILSVVRERMQQACARLQRACAHLPHLILQISWLYILVQSWSWSLDVTRSGAGKTANVHKSVAFVLFRQTWYKKAFSKREIWFQLSTAQLWVTAFYFSVILITLVAFSSGKQHTLMMTECIILSIGHSHGCKWDKYRTYTFPMGCWGPSVTCSKSVPVYKKSYRNTGRMLLFRFL